MKQFKPKIKKKANQNSIKEEPVFNEYSLVSYLPNPKAFEDSYSTSRAQSEVQFG